MDVFLAHVGLNHVPNGGYNPLGDHLPLFRRVHLEMGGHEPTGQHEDQHDNPCHDDGFRQHKAAPFGS